jgi:hypothetical protein
MLHCPVKVLGAGISHTKGPYHTEEYRVKSVRLDNARFDTGATYVLWGHAAGGTCMKATPHPLMLDMGDWGTR